MNHKSKLEEQLALFKQEMANQQEEAVSSPEGGVDKLNKENHWL